LKIGEAYAIDDEYIEKTKQSIPRMLFMRGRCYDLLCVNAFTNPPFPQNISEEEKEEFKGRFEEFGLKFQDQATEIYRLILKYAEQKYAAGEYVQHAYVRLYQLSREEYGEKVEAKQTRVITSGPQWKSSSHPAEGWNGLEYNDEQWSDVVKAARADTTLASGFPGMAPPPMQCGAHPLTGPAVKTFFRRTFYTNELTHSAELLLAAAGPIHAFFNGEELRPADSSGTPPAEGEPYRYDLQGKIRKGKNVLGVSLDNTNGGNSEVYAYLEATVSALDYVPRPPGSDGPLDATAVAEGVYKFPFIKNFNLSFQKSQAN
jgi:hypothetical protein